MEEKTIDALKHHHSFGTDQKTKGERRTWWVIGLTFVMMSIEIGAGMWFGSMALLADGWHMGTHAAALGVTAFAYVYARRHAHNPQFTFGTGKVGALGGFASAVSLAVVALLVLGESLHRLASPVAIRFNEAILVAVIGLVVNLLSAYLLRGDEHGHGHAHGGHGHGGHGTHSHGGHGHAGSSSEQQHHDHNLRAAYLHVLADALTSVLAIFALIAGKYWAWNWMDPMMGVVGSVVIGKWSVGLLQDTAKVLLDAEIAEEKRKSIEQAIENDGTTHITDLHVWRVGPKHLAVIVSVVSATKVSPQQIKERLHSQRDLAHITVEILSVAEAQ